MNTDEIRAPFHRENITIASDKYALVASDDGGATFLTYFPAGFEPPFTEGRIYAQVVPTEHIRARIKALQRDLDRIEGRTPERKRQSRRATKDSLQAPQPALPA